MEGVRTPHDAVKITMLKGKESDLNKLSGTHLYKDAYFQAEQMLGDQLSVDQRLAIVDRIKLNLSKKIGRY